MNRMKDFEEIELKGSYLYEDGIRILADNINDANYKYEQKKREEGECNHADGTDD